MMRHRFAKWLAALGVATALAVPTAFAAQERPAQPRVSSFAGAYLAARAAETDNDLDTAIGYYRRALSFQPSNRAIRQSLMVALIAVGEFDEALPHAEVLKEVPEVERFSRLALAIDAVRKSEYAAAGDWLELSLESDLDRLITGLIGAWALSGEGDTQAALQAVDALSGPPWFDLFVTYHRALIAERGGDVETALAAYVGILDNPGAGGAAPEAFMRAAESYVGHLARLGEADEALAVLDRIEEILPGRVQAAALRDRIEAGEDVPPLVASPAEGASEVLLNLGSALNRGGGESFVRLYLSMALALRPDSDAALMQLAALAEMMQQPERAIDLYSRVPAISPVKRIAELQLGLNLADLERHEEAVEHLEAALESDPEDIRAYLALGGVYSVRKDYAEAAEIYELAVERIGDEPEPAHWNVFYQRGIAYERLDEWEKAEPNFKKALELHPDHPQVLNYLGYSWIDMDMNLEEGLELIRKAVELRPRDGYIVDSLGWAYYKLGRYEDAVRELERAVSLMPNDPILNDHLGDAYWKVGRELEATFQWSHARAMDPEPELLAEVEEKLRNGLTDDEASAAVMVADAAGGGLREEAEATEVTEVAAGEERETEVAVLDAPASPATAVTPEDSAYVVQRGQSLWRIAVETLGSGGRYRELIDLNPDLQRNPHLIFPGQRLILPSPAE